MLGHRAGFGARWRNPSAYPCRTYDRTSSASHAWVAFVEAAALAVVALITAWSGYEASRWGGDGAMNYALYERYTVLSQEKNTLAGQDRLYDIVTFNGWVAAKIAGREPLAAFYQRRFRPEYAVAFAAWLRLDPFHNPHAPPGPIFMPQYRNANAESAKRLSALAAHYFTIGATALRTVDDYVRVTVFLAIVGIAAALLVISLSWVVTLART